MLNNNDLKRNMLTRQEGRDDELPKTQEPIRVEVRSNPKRLPIRLGSHGLAPLLRT